MSFARMTQQPDKPTPPKPRLKLAASGNPRAMGEETRQTEPAHYLPNAAGGLSFIPRRGVELGGYLSTRDGLKRWAQDTPLRLLALLPDIHPAVGQALWNALRLICKPGDVEIVAVKPLSKAGGADERDDDGTAAIKALFESQPPEIGGQDGLITTLTIGAMLTGLPFLEAVPGPSGTGVRRLYPVDSLTLRFNREGDDDEVVAYQLQRFPRSGGKTGGYVALDAARMFWRPMDNFPDDPYGRAPFAAALGEVLRDLALMQDLTDAIHNAAWPRLAVPFNFKEMFEVAQLFGVTDPIEAREWVSQQFQETVAEFNKLNPADNLHYDASGKVLTIEGGKGLTSLEPILVYLRQRIMQALKTLPTLMGINDGATQTYTSVEFAVYAAGLESIRALVVDILVKAATLHLRLLGLPLIAKAVYEKIRTTDAQIEANTEATRIRNAITKRDQGWITQDQASQEITGSDAVAEAPAIAAPTAPGTAPANEPASPDPTTGEGKGDAPPKDSGNSEQ